MKKTANDTKHSAPLRDPSPELGFQAGSDHIIIPRCGQANTGQITNEAAMVLSDEGFGQYYCTALLATNPEIIQTRIKGAEKIVAIDGCTMACAKKIALQAGLTVDYHVLVTDLGIEKKKERSFTQKEIEDVIDTIRRGY